MFVLFVGLGGLFEIIGGGFIDGLLVLGLDEYIWLLGGGGGGLFIVVLLWYILVLIISVEGKIWNNDIYILINIKFVNYLCIVGKLCKNLNF